MEYRPRLVDTELDAHLEGLPAVSLEGPKAVGTTIITTGHEAFRRADGIGVIPAGLLTA